MRGDISWISPTRRPRHRKIRSKKTMREAMPREKNLMRLKIRGMLGGNPPIARSQLFSVLAYFSVLWLVGLLADPDNPKVRFHVNQGILLSIFSAAYSLAMTVLNAAFTYLPFLFIFTALLSVLGGAAVLALMVWGIVNAAQDKEEPLPILGTLYTFIQ